MRDLSENLRPPGHKDAEYSCPLCGVAFKSFDTKIKHLETAHDYETLEVKPIGR